MAAGSSVLLAAAVLTCTFAGMAFSQSPSVGSNASPPAGGAGLRSGNIAATGQTVPDPQTLPSAPQSAVDRDIKGKDAGRTDYGICKGC